MTPLDAEPPSVRIARAALEAIAVGDMERTMAAWADGFVYYGFDADGSNREFRGRHEFLEMMRGTQQLLESHEVTIVDVRPVGSELVTAHIHAHNVARGTGVDIEADYLLVLRVRDNQIVFACDFIDSAAQEFLDQAWSSAGD